MNQIFTIGKNAHYTVGVFTESCSSKEVDHSSLAEQFMDIASNDSSVETTVNAFDKLTELSGEFVVHTQYDPNV